MNRDCKIFKNVISVNNNRSTFYSKNDSENEIEVNKKIENNISSNINIKDKINDIFKNKRFMYTKEVNVKLKDKTINTRFISINNDKILTIDNEIIYINDILDIN